VSYYDSLALAALGQSIVPLNTSAVQGTSVGPGSSWAFAPWLDTALTVHGIPTSEAQRVLSAIRDVLQHTGAEVNQVQWGGGEGLETIAGKIYVRWRPDKPYNAVDYANIARALFLRAADGFPAGAQIVMNRYRIHSFVPFQPDLYVYPDVAMGLPPSAPELARGTNAASLPAPVEEPSGIEASFATGVPPEAVVAGVGAGAVVLGLGAWWYWKRRRPAVVHNRGRRMRRVRR
jgi:hypothetical protein